MKYSQLYGKTTHGEAGGSKFTSHQLLTKGGFIQESTAGRYYFLPLGWRVHDKLKQLIKEEMDGVGGQEMITPVLHPLELWEETNRTSSVGFELMGVSDARGAKFALGGTAEEMFVDSVRRMKLSYRDLPLNLYQFSTKFRDEKRARGGLLRVREFVMKDAYSFNRNEAEFLAVYEQMAAVYSRIFERVGLSALRVAADNGYIGGEYCHEYQVESEIGEGRFFISEDGKYIAHEDIANFAREQMNPGEELKPYAEVEAVRGPKMADGVAFHNLPLWQQMKDVLVADEKGNLILAVIRGDLDVNETKLAKAAGAFHLRPATIEEIKSLGSEAGFISPVGLRGKLKIVGDLSLRGVKNMYGGANKLNCDALNMNIDRDFSVDIEDDIAMCQPGFLAVDTMSPLLEKRGVEVGNIFQLGYHYTKLMKGATFVDENGQDQPFYMGCYGIGLGRTIATVVEKYHDDKGIIWPASIAPYQLHLISLPGGEEKAAAAYNTLEAAGIEVLWDDRSESAGIKFSDADLIGIPLRAIISKKTGDNVEVKDRSTGEVQLLSVADLVTQLTK
ncbi:MAG: proline--tRNA ligase [bacterium]|nr:proline--tRNA ligase [bacterium]